MRKHIRTRRLSEVRQLGIDRVIDFRFGEGETAYHVFVEFYAAVSISLIFFFFFFFWCKGKSVTLNLSLFVPG